MRTLVVVVGDPVVKVTLRLFDAAVNLTAEGDLVELLQDRLVEAFADAVCLGIPASASIALIL
jgi:4-hydroxy-3-methylbut-2-enyl diphosphate reductase IspH